jgi:c(7)-type cytochrome triheme protein
MKFTLALITAILMGTVTAGAIELKDFTYNTEGAGKVVFSHTSHLKKKSKKSANVSCKACHNASYKKGVHYTMADMEKGKSCGMCHGKTAFALSKCTECHKVKNITYNVKETGPTVFSHTKHLKKMQCNSCHTKLYATGANKRVSMAEMEKGKSCGSCHNAKDAFALSECTKCHPVKEVEYKVKDAGNVKFSHEFHLGMYKCNECHTGIYLPKSGNKVVTMAEMENAKSCGVCHDSKTAFTVKENCDKCHK